MLPSLREERQQTYSPFLPLHPRTGVRHAGADRRGAAATPAPSSGAIPDTGERFETPVTGGHAKLQWKPDWAMRWVALGVDYEMAGKDLIDCVKLSGEIARALGGDAAGGLQLRALPRREGPEDLEVEGQRPDHRRLARLRHAGKPVAVHVQPSRARRSGCSSTSSRAHVDDYLDLPREISRARTPRRGSATRSGTSMPARRRRPSSSVRRQGQPGTTISFAMLLNLVAVANSEEPGVLWGFIRRYAPGVSPATHPRLDRLVGHAVRYFRDFVRPAKRYRAAERGGARGAARARRRRSPPPEGSTDAEALQAVVYEVGRRAFPRHLRQVEEPGRAARRVAGLVRDALPDPARARSADPRFGSFVALYGVAETRALIAQALARRPRARARGVPESARAARGRVGRKITAAPTSRARSRRSRSPGSGGRRARGSASAVRWSAPCGASAPSP